jgi:hypothetical protein
MYICIYIYQMYESDPCCLRLLHINDHNMFFVGKGAALGEID